ncbi:MAG: hypothetical protein JKY45_06710 [Emcibacter sp.]|nr:hypothetical protein [Emcibacter sp.]
MSLALQNSTGTSPNTSAFGNLSGWTYFAVLDRRNPTAAPLFNGVSKDNTTVPKGLAVVLTTDSLLFAGTASWCSGMPQGELYHLLASNGGGRLLQRMESLAVNFACGVNNALIYLMASVPGSGLPGLEALGEYPDNTRIVMDLVPNASGLFTPIAI